MPRIAFSEVQAGVAYAIDPASTQGLVNHLQQQGVPADVCADVALMQQKFGSWPNDDLNAFQDSVDAFEAYLIGKYGTSNIPLQGTADLYTNEGKSAYLLTGAAILRNSMSYWSEHLLDPESPWYDPQTANRPNILERGWADIEGFFRGLRGRAVDRNGDGTADGYEFNVLSPVTSACDASSNG